jgi:hypothetical protein
MLWPLCLLAAALLPLASPSFTYLNFNDTGSLRFNGDASTSSCDDGGPYVYSSLHAVGDGQPSDGQGLLVSEGTSTRTETSVLPFEAAASAAASRLLAGFPSRDAYGGSPDAAGGGCPVRLRLTPSRAFKASSVLRLEAQAVLAGWETGFTLQLTDPSRQCSQVKDATFGAASHRACTVAGGDGLAFVLHGDPRTGSRALGGGGGGLGYSGLPATLAVEFDTWYNAEGSGESGDLPYDHVSVQASPAGGGGGGAAAAEALPAVPATTATRVSGPPLRVNLGDGQLHTVRIAYYPYIKMDFVQRFVGAPPLLQHLGAAGQASAIGTLAVWVDEAAGGETAGAAPGAAQNASLLPTLALPINLHQVLRMDADRAWPGFTASTGSTAWQKHDVLQWYWCDQVGCR